MSADTDSGDYRSVDGRPRAPGSLGEAAERIVHLEDWLTRLDELAAGLDPRGASVVAAGSPPCGPVTPGEEWLPLFSSLAEFVDDFLVVAFPRTLGGPAGMWCAQWWDHAEAILRLEALWRTFETARLDPNQGMAVWLAHSLDHHLSVLMSGTGPFGQCRPDEHRPPPPLPSLPAPDGWWEPLTHTDGAPPPTPPTG